MAVLLFSVLTFGCERSEDDNYNIEDIKSACEEAGYAFCDDKYNGAYKEGDEILANFFFGFKIFKYVKY